MTTRCILAAVGQFPRDEAVLTRAHAIAAIHQATLVVAHMVDLPGADAELDRYDSLAGQAAFAMRDRIKAALAGLGASADQVDIRIKPGSPALGLIGICQDLRPDLVVMRAHQKARISEKLLGSTTERMIAAHLASVLVLKRPSGRPYQRALVATNGEDDALEAVRFTAALLPEVRLQLVQAVEIAPQLKQAMLRTGTSQEALKTHRTGLRRQAGEHLEGLVARAPRRVSRRILTGDAATALSRASRSPRVDLIALGPGRSSLIRRAFIGSVTRRLLRDADCDILICRAES